MKSLEWMRIHGDEERCIEPPPSGATELKSRHRDDYFLFINCQKHSDTVRLTPFFLVFWFSSLSRSPSPSPLWLPLINYVLYARNSTISYYSKWNISDNYGTFKWLSHKPVRNSNKSRNFSTPKSCVISDIFSYKFWMSMATKLLFCLSISFTSKYL